MTFKGHLLIIIGILHYFLLKLLALVFRHNRGQPSVLSGSGYQSDYILSVLNALVMVTEVYLV